MASAALQPLLAFGLLASFSLARPSSRDTLTIMQDTGATYQMGRFPYINVNGMAGGVVGSEEECKALCKDDVMCKYGTFVTKSATALQGHAYATTAVKGECWLSTTTHKEPTPCGVPCRGFRKAIVDSTAGALRNHGAVCGSLTADNCRKCVHARTALDNMHQQVKRWAAFHQQAESASLDTQCALRSTVAECRSEDGKDGCFWDAGRYNGQVGKCRLYRVQSQTSMLRHTEGLELYKLDFSDGALQAIREDPAFAKERTEVRLSESLVDEAWRLHRLVQSDVCRSNECRVWEADPSRFKSPATEQWCQDNAHLAPKRCYATNSLASGEKLNTARSFSELETIWSRYAPLAQEKLCWDGKTIVQRDSTIESCPFLPCPARPPCECDPAKHPSFFNTCTQDPWNPSVIVVKHLAPRFHGAPFEDGSQHKCGMTTASKCQCCTCRPDGAFDNLRARFTDLGFNTHLVPSDLATVRRIEKKNYEECYAECDKDRKCLWGSFIVHDHTDSVTCILSDTCPQVDTMGKFEVVECPIGQKCHSFEKDSSKQSSIRAFNKGFARKDMCGVDVAASWVSLKKRRS